jgi:hypothetical protein
MADKAISTVARVENNPGFDATAGTLRSKAAAPPTQTT